MAARNALNLPVKNHSAPIQLVLMMVDVGDRAPDFSLADADGVMHSLKEFRGHAVVLYFYPRDDTPGCTIEACEFRDLDKEFRKKGAVVIGVSKDEPRSHAKFRDKHKLPFLLLSDPGHKAIEAYGSWAPKKFMGREFLGTHRDTFIIGKSGKITRVYRGVIPLGHARGVLGQLQD